MTQEQAKFVDEFIYLTSKNTDRARCLAEGFFIANVCIPKGTNRHPYADVLHLAVEGIHCERKLFSNMSNWENLEFTNEEYRIKPSKPAFEYKVAMYFTDGTYEYTEKYFTREEYRDFGFPASCSLKEETKRIRQ